MKTKGGEVTRNDADEDTDADTCGTVGAERKVQSGK